MEAPANRQCSQYADPVYDLDKNHQVRLNFQFKTSDFGRLCQASCVASVHPATMGVTNASVSTNKL
jgi:hypothetical protein